MAITPASQAGDVSSILITRSNNNQSIKEHHMKDLIGAILIHIFFAIILIWLIFKIAG